jgi:hypothetical protein
MWGMYIGMDLARRQGIIHLQVESDLKVLVDMVTRNCKVNGRIPTLIRRIRDLKTLDWQIQINHTWREGNRSADWLANFNLILDSFDLQKFLRLLLDRYEVSFLMIFPALVCLGMFD